jgi:hypothetical protein
MNGLSGRIKFVPGSFMQQPLPKGDVMMMGHILHDWNLETKRMLVRKAYEALAERTSCTKALSMMIAR